MSERHLASQLIHTISFLQGLAARLDTLTNHALQAATPQFKKAANDCRTHAERLSEALHKEGYDRAY